MLWQETTLAYSQVPLNLGFTNGVWLDVPLVEKYFTLQVKLQPAWLRGDPGEFKHVTGTEYSYRHVLNYWAAALTPGQLTLSLALLWGLGSSMQATAWWVESWSPESPNQTMKQERPSLMKKEKTWTYHGCGCLPSTVVGLLRQPYCQLATDREVDCRFKTAHQKTKIK